jgi:hypothetical protein
VKQVHDSLHKLLASKRAKKPGSGWLEFLYEIQYSLNTQCHSSIKMTPFEAVFGQTANDGICVGSQETGFSAFLKPTVCEESHALVPLNPVFDTEGDLQTGVQTDNGIDSLSDTETDSQTETETDSQITDADKACRSSEIMTLCVKRILYLI